MFVPAWDTNFIISLFHSTAYFVTVDKAQEQNKRTVSWNSHLFLFAMMLDVRRFARYLSSKLLQYPCYSGYCGGTFNKAAGGYNNNND